MLNTSEGRFDYIGEDTLVSRIGCSLFFFSLSSQKSSTLKFPVGYTVDGWSVSNFTPAGQGEAQIVVALSGAETRVHVYSWPRLHLEQSYLTEEDVCINHLALSRDGRHLVGVTSESHVQLRYWDLQSPDIDIQISDDPDLPTNRLLRDREVRLTLPEEATFLSINPFNHTQVVVGNERSVQIVTITAATSFQLATLTPQQVMLDSGLTHRRILSHTWLTDRQLLLSAKSGEILSVHIQPPPSVVALRERDIGPSSSGGSETPGPGEIRSVSGGNLTPATLQGQHGGATSGDESEIGLNQLSDADLALLGLVDPKLPPHLNPTWRTTVSDQPSTLHATVWATNLPSAPISSEEEQHQSDEKEDPHVTKHQASAPINHTGLAIANCLALTRYEVVVGTNDGCLLWLNKHTQAVVHQQHIDVSQGDTGILSLSFSPSYATFVALTRRGHLRLFKPLTDRSAPSGSDQPSFQTSSLGHFPVASALDIPAPLSVASQSLLPNSAFHHRQPIRVGHVLIPTHPSDLQPKNFKLISFTGRGMLQLWCYGTRTLLGTFHFKSGITAAAVSHDGLLAMIGLDSGVVNVLDISNPSYMRLIFSHRFHSGPVIEIDFNKDGDVFATMGPQKVFFIRTGDFKMIGYTKLEEWKEKNKAEQNPIDDKIQGDSPATTFTSLIGKTNSDAEAQKMAERALIEEKLKYDDEEELVAGQHSMNSSANASTNSTSNLLSPPSDSLLSMCWSSPVDRERRPNDRLVLTTKMGNVYVITTPNIYHDAQELKLEFSFLEPVCTTLPSSVGALLSIQSNLGDRTILYGMGEKDKMLHVYQLQYDSELKLQRSLNNDIPDPDNDIEDVGPDGLVHQKASTVSAQALTGNLVATSGRDGMIVLRDGESLTYFTRFPLHDYIVGGTVSLSISPDSSLLVSSGYDGGLIVCDLAPLQPLISTRRTRKLRNLQSVIGSKVLENLNEVDECAGVSEISYLQLHYKTGSGGRQLHEHDLQQKILRDELLKSLTTFKLQFNEILARNANLPDLERLSYQDFAIDIELKEFLQKEGDARVAALREEIHLECIGKEYVIQRIREQCWNSMEVKGMMLSTFKSGTEVHNYPIRALNPKESKRIRQLQFLRRMEIVEKRWRIAQSLKIDESDAVREKNSRTASDSSILRD